MQETDAIVLVNVEYDDEVGILGRLVEYRITCFDDNAP